MAPRIYHLGEYSKKTEGVALIIGEGLCSNIYVIGNENVVMIDAGVGNTMNPIWPQLTKLGITPEKVKGIVITHAHHDHAMGVYIILEKANPKVYVHSLDSKHIANSFGETLISVEDGDVIDTELWPLKVIWTPGHTGGGMCLYNEANGILFSGDTVFPNGSFGRYDGITGNFNALIESLKKLSQLQVEVMLPGHGSPIFESAQDHILRSYRNASGNYFT